MASLVAMPTSADPVRVTIRASEHEASAVPVRVTASSVVTDPGREPETIVRDVAVPATLTIELDRGITWRLTVAAQGFWAPETLVVGGTPPREVSVELVPTALLTARVEVLHAGERPPILSVRLRSPGGPSAPGVFDETLECPIEEGIWRCEVPAGIFDLRLRSAGFISHYFWEHSLQPKGVIDLGTVALKPGSSITGWLVTDDGSPLREGIEVVAVPRKIGTGDPREGEKHRRLAVTAAVDERGFFHVAGLQPGAYVLRAEQQGFVPLRSLPVIVIDATESELREPLVLTRPAELRVLLDPPVDAAGEPWKLRLLNQNVSAPVASGRNSSDGWWTAAALDPGPYVLMVADSKDSRLASEDLVVEPPRTEHLVTLTFVEVDGRLTLGDEPLAAELAFGGTSGMTSVRMESDDEGRFSGSLPRAGTWSVDVRSESPQIFRRLREVEIDPAPGTSQAKLSIELPGTRLEGEVVDPEGRGIENATVLAIPVPQKPGDPSEKPSYTRTGKGGLFSFDGFEPAKYRLQAIVANPSGQQRQSEPLEVELREDDPFTLVRLVFRPSLRVTGRVLSVLGAVPGATVTARPEGTHNGILIPSSQTAPDGRFELELPAGTPQAQVTVMAPGFLLYRRFLPVIEDQELAVELEQQGGGTLVIRPAAPIDLAAGRGLPHVWRSDGVWFSLATLARWAAFHEGPGVGATLEVPQMPAGGYSVCWSVPLEEVLAGRERECSEGYLPAFGRLEISQSRPEDDPEEVVGE